MKRVLLGTGKALLLLLALAAAALPAVYTNSVYGYLPVLALAAALLLSWLALLRLRRSLSVETGAGGAECRRGESVDIALTVKNRSRLACPGAAAYLTISDLFGQGDSGKILRFAIGGGGTVALDLDMDMRHIGLYDVGIERIELRDFLGIFRARVPVDGKLTALVTPRLRPMDEYELEGEESVEASRDTRVTVVGGTDYTGVREYALGDPMKQIHWKLSAHSREYVTKLQESSRQQEFVVLLDFAAEPSGDREALMELNDCLIETALSLIDEVSRRDAETTLLFVDRNHGIRRTPPRGPDAFDELLRTFAFITPAGGEFPDASHVLREESKTAGRATNILVVTSRVTEELLQELQKVKRQKRSGELFYVIPAVWTARERENAAARLRTLGELEIPYYFVSTAESFKQ